MPAVIALIPFPGDVSPEALLCTLRTISPVGVRLLRPVYAEADRARLVDYYNFYQAQLVAWVGQ